MTLENVVPENISFLEQFQIGKFRAKNRCESPKSVPDNKLTFSETIC